MKKVLFPFLLYFLCVLSSARAQEIVDIAIVGGGLGGLTLQYRLQQQGRESTLFESSNRLGGRVYTERNWADPSVTAERGAETVNNQDQALMGLLRELEVELVPRPSVIQKQEWVYLLEGRKWTHSELEKEIFVRNEDALKKIVRWPSESSLNEKSLYELLLQANADPLLSTYIQNIVANEYGRSLKTLSASLLFDLLEIDLLHHSLKNLPHGDLGNRIQGGSDSLIQKLQQITDPNIKMEHRLISVTRRENHPFVLEFLTPQGKRQLLAYQLVIALPFSATKDITFNMEGLNLKVLKEAQRAGYATNSKIMMSFHGKPWAQYGFSGTGMSESGYHFWDTTETQNSPNGILTFYPEKLPEISVERQAFVDLILNEMDFLFPGTKKQFREFKISEWEFSYSGAQRPGERLTSEIVDDLKVKNLYWIGEDKSKISAGYMNGAVETAESTSRLLFANPSCRTLLSNGILKKKGW